MIIDKTLSKMKGMIKFEKKQNQINNKIVE